MYFWFLRPVFGFCGVVSVFSIKLLFSEIEVFHFYSNPTRHVGFQVEPFTGPVDRATFPDYDKYVVHAVDLGLMKESIDAGVYGSTEAFASDAQWILHNSIIFNTRESLYRCLLHLIKFINTLASPLSMQSSSRGFV